ncbi:coronafacic acid polyketide synthase I, partial [Lasiosphaeria ovina]
MVLLKRLFDAQRDGNIVHAVLRGTAVSHSGRSASLTAPNGPSQARLIRKALGESSLQADGIDYIEAHGTATKLGDLIEGQALADVLSGSHPETRPLWVGSSKSDIGHIGAAAGVTDMIKVALALCHGVLPRTLHVTEPISAVDWKRIRIGFVQGVQPWVPKEGRRRRAGVSSFGIGGTGAHVIVEEPPQL